MSVENSLKSTLLHCLNQQITEYEVLKSIYSGVGEIILSDTSIINEIQQYMQEQTDSTPNNLDYIVHLKISNLSIEMCVDLPSFYPKEEPDICIRCNQLNRQQETQLNNEVYNFIKDNICDEAFLYSVITWLQDNVDIILETSKVKVVENLPINDKIEVEEKFARYWIYSHHIYNKRKREEISNKAKILNLDGFCLLGQPGIICIEGFESHCKEWYRDIKSLSWKKIAVKKIELFDLERTKQEKRFSMFEEIFFTNTGTSKNNKHADMSSFYKYVEKFNLSSTLNDFFGLCNE